jgi:hypothetical protein
MRPPYSYMKAREKLIGDKQDIALDTAWYTEEFFLRV